MNKRSENQAWDVFRQDKEVQSDVNGGFKVFSWDTSVRHRNICPEFLALSFQDVIYHIAKYKSLKYTRSWVTEKLDCIEFSGISRLGKTGMGDEESKWVQWFVYYVIVLWITIQFCWFKKFGLIFFVCLTFFMTGERHKTDFAPPSDFRLY